MIRRDLSLTVFCRHSRFSVQEDCECGPTGSPNIVSTEICVCKLHVLLRTICRERYESRANSSVYANRLARICVLRDLFETWQVCPGVFEINRGCQGFKPIASAKARSESTISTVCCVDFRTRCDTETKLRSESQRVTVCRRRSTGQTMDYAAPYTSIFVVAGAQGKLSKVLNFTCLQFSFPAGWLAGWVSTVWLERFVCSEI